MHDRINAVCEPARVQDIAIEKREFSIKERVLTTSSQDSEVFLFSAKKQDDLKALLEQVR